MSLASCVYRGTVRHARREPRANEFEYRLYMLYMDLDELPWLFEKPWLWSFERKNVFSFRRRDYLGDPQQPLADCVRDVVEQRLGRRPRGPVRMLTQVRSFGYVFNPVTFYYCFGVDDELEAVVAEITNTPWGERHRYVLRAEGGMARAKFAKEFHVSPFMGMDHEYEWTFSAPGDELRVGMANRNDGERVFDVGLRLERREWNAAALRAVAVRHPLMSVKILGAIYWQALRLRWKRTPFYPHPRLATEDATCDS